MKGVSFKFVLRAHRYLVRPQNGLPHERSYTELTGDDLSIMWLQFARERGTKIQSDGIMRAGTRSVLDHTAESAPTEVFFVWFFLYRSRTSEATATLKPCSVSCVFYPSPPVVI